MLLSCKHPARCRSSGSGSYGGVVRSGVVTGISGVSGAFTVESSDSEVATRRVIDATGLTDSLSNIRGIAELWGNRVFHCSFCHGWEARDAAVAVLGWNDQSPRSAVMLTQ